MASLDVGLSLADAAVVVSGTDVSGWTTLESKAKASDFLAPGASTSASDSLAGGNNNDDDDGPAFVERSPSSSATAVVAADNPTKKSSRLFKK